MTIFCFWRPEDKPESQLAAKRLCPTRSHGSETRTNWYRAEMREDPVNLHEVIAAAGERAGVVWSLRGSEDLNANLVRFTSGRGVDEHTNAEVDVIFVGISGSGVVTIDGDEHPLSAGTIAFVPKGTQRSTGSTSEDFAYLTVHRRRGLLQIEDR